MTDTDWWRGATIYQVYPRSFQDTTGDGMGDLPGITRRLPHIASLGVDAVWISPFFPSPMADMGYDVSDFRGVDPMFGTMDDFRTLLDRAHDLGLKVIIDQILSHSSDQHRWFAQSRSSRENPYADWYVWADPQPDGTPPNNWLSVFGGPAWEWDGQRMQYYLHGFLASQPDFNLHNPAVQDELLDILRFWLDAGVDGFRLDACVHYFHDRHLRSNPPAPPEHHAPDVPLTNPYGFQDHLYDKSQPENLAFLQRIRHLLDSYGDRVALGEIGDGPRSPITIGQYTGGGDKLHASYTFDLFGHDLSPAFFRAPIELFEQQAGDGWACWSLSNHDVARHVSRWLRPGSDPRRLARLAIHILVALRGTICIYQGEELGLTEAELTFEQLRDPYGIRFWPAFKGRDGCRTPMPWEADAPNGGFTTGTPWLPLPPEHLAMSADVQELSRGSVLADYRAAIGLRKRHRAIAYGNIRFHDAPPGLLAFTRAAADETILCLFNLSDRVAHWPNPPSDARCIAAGGQTMTKTEIRLEPSGFAWLLIP
ncbi:MAG: alpha-glucosidase [Sphingomonadaceae bacterium]